MPVTSPTHDYSVDDVFPAATIDLLQHPVICETATYTPLDNISLPTTQHTNSRSGSNVGPVDSDWTSFSATWSDIPFFGLSNARIEKSDPMTYRFDTPRSLPYTQPTSQQAPTPPYEALDLLSAEEIQYPAGASSPNRALKFMTSGQASLYNALFSLTQPGDEHYNPSDSTYKYENLRDLEESLPVPMSEKTGKNLVSGNTAGDNVDDPEDLEGTNAVMCRTLTLDRNVESNSLPFILESCKSSGLSTTQLHTYNPNRLALGQPNGISTTSNCTHGKGICYTKIRRRRYGAMQTHANFTRCASSDAERGLRYRQYTEPNYVPSPYVSGVYDC
jgi:hypothetical protein